MNYLDAFHDAIADHSKKCLYIDSENKGAGETTHRNALRSGKTYAAYVRPGIVALDVDSEDAKAQTGFVTEKLEQIGFSPVALESSAGSGRVHLYIPYDSEEQYHLAVQIAKNEYGRVDDRSRMRIRPPFSPPKIGKAEMSLIYPATEDEALERLRMGTGKLEARSSKPTPAEIPAGCSEIPIELVRMAAKPVEKGKRSEHLWAIATHAKAYGLSANQYADLVLSERHGAGSKAHQKPNPKGWLIEQVYMKAPVADLRSQTPIPEIEWLAECADRWVPPKRKAGAKALLEQIVNQIQLTGKTEISLSVRDAQILTGSSTETAARRLRWLNEMGWLQKVERGSAIMATVYKVTVPEDALREYTHIHPQSIEGGCKLGGCTRKVQEQIRKAMESFHGWNIGLLIAYELANQGGRATLKSLSDKLGRRPSAIRDHLERMEMYGLVSLQNGEYVLDISEEKLEELAVARNKKGIRDRIRRDVERHRQGWRDHLINCGMSKRTERELRNLLERTPRLPGAGTVTVQ